MSNVIYNQQDQKQNRVSLLVGGTVVETKARLAINLPLKGRVLDERNSNEPLFISVDLSRPYPAELPALPGIPVPTTALMDDTEQKSTEERITYYLPVNNEEKELFLDQRQRLHYRRESIRLLCELSGHMFTCSTYQNKTLHFPIPQTIEGIKESLLLLVNKTKQLQQGVFNNSSHSAHITKSSKTNRDDYEEVINVDDYAVTYQRSNVEVLTLKYSVIEHILEMLYMYPSGSVPSMTQASPPGSGDIVDEETMPDIITTNVYDDILGQMWKSFRTVNSAYTRHQCDGVSTEAASLSIPFVFEVLGHDVVNDTYIPQLPLFLIDRRIQRSVSEDSGNYGSQCPSSYYYRKLTTENNNFPLRKTDVNTERDSNEKRMTAYEIENLILSRVKEATNDVCCDNSERTVEEEKENIRSSEMMKNDAASYAMGVKYSFPSFPFGLPVWNSGNDKKLGLDLIGPSHIVRGDGGSLKILLNLYKVNDEDVIDIAETKLDSSPSYVSGMCTENRNRELLTKALTPVESVGTHLLTPSQTTHIINKAMDEVKSPTNRESQYSLYGPIHSSMEWCTSTVGQCNTCVQEKLLPYYNPLAPVESEISSLLSVPFRFLERFVEEVVAVALEDDNTIGGENQNRSGFTHHATVPMFDVQVFAQFYHDLVRKSLRQYYSDIVSGQAPQEELGDDGLALGISGCNTQKPTSDTVLLNVDFYTQEPLEIIHPIMVKNAKVAVMNNNDDDNELFVMQVENEEENDDNTKEWLPFECKEKSNILFNVISERGSKHHKVTPNPPPPPPISSTDDSHHSKLSLSNVGIMMRRDAEEAIRNRIPYKEIVLEDLFALLQQQTVDYLSSVPTAKISEELRQHKRNMQKRLQIEDKEKRKADEELQCVTSRSTGIYRNSSVMSPCTATQSITDVKPKKYTILEDAISEEEDRRRLRKELELLKQKKKKEEDLAVEKSLLLSDPKKAAVKSFMKYGVICKAVLIEYLRTTYDFDSFGDSLFYDRLIEKSLVRPNRRLSIVGRQAVTASLSDSMTTIYSICKSHKTHILDNNNNITSQKFQKVTANYGYSLTTDPWTHQLLSGEDSFFQNIVEDETCSNSHIPHTPTTSGDTPSGTTVYLRRRFNQALEYASANNGNSTTQICKKSPSNINNTIITPESFIVGSPRKSPVECAINGQKENTGKQQLISDKGERSLTQLFINNKLGVVHAPGHLPVLTLTAPTSVINKYSNRLSEEGANEGTNHIILATNEDKRQRRLSTVSSSSNIRVTWPKDQYYDTMIRREEQRRQTVQEYDSSRIWRPTHCFFLSKEEFYTFMFELTKM